MIRAFLFDIGNVLVRFDYGRVFRALAEEVGDERVGLLEPGIRALGQEMERGALSSDEFVGEVVGQLGGKVGAEEFRRVFNDIFWLNEPMESLVAQLRGRVPLYLFSNTSELHERHLFASYPVFRQFDGGFYSWSAGCMKPDESFYHGALAELGLAPSEIAYVDDLPDNIATGRRIGLVSHAYDHGRHKEFEAFVEALALP